MSHGRDLANCPEQCRPVAAGTPIVWLVGRYARRPALTHGLAVILLLKLITPPLWRVPITWPEKRRDRHNHRTANRPDRDAADTVRLA